MYINILQFYSLFLLQSHISARYVLVVLNNLLFSFISMTEIISGEECEIDIYYGFLSHSIVRDVSLYTIPHL